MRLGLKSPERFASVYAHSAAFRVDEVMEPLDPALIADVEDVSVYRHAKAVAKRGSHPVISFDCGTGDDLLEHNRRFHEHLQELNIEHHYAEFDGGHDWDYWDNHVRDALAQHARVLGLTEMATQWAAARDAAGPAHRPGSVGRSWCSPG